MPRGDRQCAVETAANLMAQFKFTWQSWSSLQAALEKGLFTLALYFWMHFSSCAAAQLPNTEGLYTIIKRFNFFSSLAAPSLHLALIGQCSDRTSFQTTRHKHHLENNSIAKKVEQKPKKIFAGCRNKREWFCSSQLSAGDPSFCGTLMPCFLSHQKNLPKETITAFMLGGSGTSGLWRRRIWNEGSLSQLMEGGSHLPFLTHIFWRCWYGLGRVKSRSHLSFLQLEKQQQMLAPVPCVAPVLLLPFYVSLLRGIHKTAAWTFPELAFPPAS